MTIWVGGSHGTRTQTEELVLRFKTTRPTGLLLVTSADSNSPDRLEISLVAGRVRASVRLGDREKVSFFYLHIPFAIAIHLFTALIYSQAHLQQQKPSTNEINVLSFSKCVFHFILFYSFTALIIQNLLAGQGVLHDNNWHTIRFSRKASNLRLQVDGNVAVRGMLCMYHQHFTCPIRVVTCRF